MRNVRKLLVGLAVCAAFGSAHADVKVGVILSLTGPAASLGIPEKQTLEMWPKEIAGQKIDVTVLDDASDPTKAALAARKLTSENKVDILVGPSVTPTALAAMQVAGETKTPMLSLSGGGAIIYPQEGARTWVFKMPPSEKIQLDNIFNTMKKRGEKTLSVVGANDAYGQVFINDVEKYAPAAGIKVVSVERFGSTDTSFVSQALKIIAAKPDAVFIAASGTPAAMPQIELTNRGYKGTQYQTQAVANNDYLRIGGKAIEGTLMTVAPMLVAEQLPDSNASKAVAVPYIKAFEKIHGPGSRSLFGAEIWDVTLFLKNVIPVAMKKAKPGTPEFRVALRDALENVKDLVLTQGVYTMSVKDHNGADARSQVMVKIEHGKWKYID
ncbi:MAG TPA: ABC transporter substrate-binding protein [Eoetvoesiella sp.]|mgnify:CR=1 FL=1|jgi:branched-chain amino acid transport system substrate-binding protein|uniref:ABC transporter substrate-binding protein n=1 Tax=Eoetvoesiella sp. TaxID=1966355 RepID=UPI002CB436E3|nr:ABC transporter substrate-binding protein [Eoetvoesiella sp.]HWK60190.1 ABC transporter substrate-binding protein [Eoetvoesiella sp.]